MSKLIKKRKVSPFGERLKAVFDDDKFTSIAAKLQLSKSAITAYMQGRVPPTDVLLKIAQLTNCNLHWLLTGQTHLKLYSSVEENNGFKCPHCRMNLTVIPLTEDGGSK